jgi:hypothetical protein
MSRPKRTTIEHCTPSQMKQLLSLAAGDVSKGHPFSAQLPTGEVLSHSLNELCDNPPRSGESLIQAVCASDTPVAMLRDIKDLAKAFSMGAKNASQRSAASLVYHGSIAAALAHHGVNISERPPESRLGLYEDLATAFAAEALGQVFRLAIDRILTSTQATESR